MIQQVSGEYDPGYQFYPAGKIGSDAAG